MKNVPVDTTDMEFRLADDVQPKMKNRETGEMKINRQGVPVYEATVMVRRAELMTVSFPSPQLPDLHAGMAVELVDLAGFWWDANGRQGLSFSVTQIRPVTADQYAA
ncbi:hypothetical protein [Actinocorallia aurantiaca]|uniref:Uncharacterized protein n=1 Tax=Actinocorallia aurantiaca TaxID=46204 RepID=A0ABN3TZI7_9ACTN